MKLDSAGRLMLGLGSGAAFGALVQKGRVDRYETIFGQLRMKDGQVARVMGPAIAVGAAGVWSLVQNGKAKLDIKPFELGGIVAGGAIFGAGLALFGYCPGTSLAALGEGRRDALAGVAGMLAGAALFVRTWPKLQPLLASKNFGKVTLPLATRTSPWPWVAALGTAVVAGAVISEQRRRAKRTFWQRLFDAVGRR